jgi:hypothetical protein
MRPIEFQNGAARSTAAEGRRPMQTTDSPRDYRTALGPRFGTSTASAGHSPVASFGMSPVLLSARLMIAIARGRDDRESQDVHHVDEARAPRLRIRLDQAAA